MAFAYRPVPSESPPFSGGRHLTTTQRNILYDVAPPAEQLPRNLPPASLAGQLRVLELQRDTLNRDIAQLRAQLQAAAAPPLT